MFLLDFDIIKCLWDGLRLLLSCQDPHPIAEISIQSKIDPLLLLRLRSDHPPRLWHYANQNPELQVPPEPSDALLLLSELQMTSKNPDHFLSSFVFIILF